MATLNLISVSGWKPPLISKQNKLSMPTLDVTVEVKDDDVAAYEALSDFKKLKAQFLKDMGTEFDKSFLAFSKDRFKKIQDAIEDIEERLQGKSKDEAEKLVEGANVLLKNACLTWQSELAEIGDDALNSALSKMLKTAKKPIVKAKAKCVARIVIKGLFSVVSGAADVIKDIKAADAKSAIKDLVTKVIIPFGKVAYDEYNKTWPNFDNTFKQIETHVKELAVAIGALAKHDADYKAGKAVSNLDVLMSAAALRANDLKEQMGVLDGLVVQYVGKIAAQRKQIEVLEKQGDVPGLKDDLQRCSDKIQRATKILEGIAEHQATVAEMQKQLSEHKMPINVSGVLKTLVTAIAEGRKGMEALSTVLAALKSVDAEKLAAA